MSVDLNDFSKKDFDVKAWLNNSLDSLSKTTKSTKTTTTDHQPNTKIKPFDDNGISILLTKLHFMSSEAQANLDRARIKFVQSAPRLTRDIAALGKDLLATQQSAKMLHPYLLRSDEVAHDALARTVRMQSVRSQMVQNKNVLERAQEWATLPKQVEELKKNDKFEEAWQLVRDSKVAAQEVVDSLGDMPSASSADKEAGDNKSIGKQAGREAHSEHHKRLLEQLSIVDDLENDLIADVQTNLQQSMRTGDADQARQWIDFLYMDSVGQKQHVFTTIINERPKPWIQIWNHLLHNLVSSPPSPTSKQNGVSETAGGSSDYDIEPLSTAQLLTYKLPDLSTVKSSVLITYFESTLGDFYDRLVNALNDELNWYALIGITDIPGTCAAWLKSICQQIAIATNAFLVAVKNRITERGGSDSLLLMIQAYETTAGFISKAEEDIKASQSVFSAASTNPSDGLSIKTRVSVSTVGRNNSVSSSSLLSLSSPQWALLLLRPFTLYQQQYPELERSFLKWQLSTEKLQIPEIPSEITEAKLVESIQTVRDFIVLRFFSIVTDAVGRSHAFTGGFAFHALIKVFEETVFSTFFANLLKFVEAVRKHCNAPDNLEAILNSNIKADNSGGVQALESFTEENPDNIGMSIRLLLLLADTCLKIKDHVRELVRNVADSFSELHALLELYFEEEADDSESMTKQKQDGSKLLNQMPLPPSAYNLLFQSTLFSTTLKDTLDKLCSSQQEPLPSSNSSIRSPLSPLSSYMSSVGSTSVFPQLETSFCNDLPLKIQNMLFNLVYKNIYISIISESPTTVYYSQSRQQEQATPNSANVTLSAMGVEIPSFSLSPSDYVRSIGENILMLPQVLEQIESLISTNISELSSSTTTANTRVSSGGHLDSGLTPIGMNTPSSTLLSATDATPRSGVLNIDDIMARLLMLVPSKSPHYSTIIANNIVSPLNTPEAEDRDKEEFSTTHIWLMSLLFSTQVHYIEHNLVPLVNSTNPEKGKKESNNGIVTVDQLSTDFGYLSSIMNSLGVDLMPKFSHWHKALGYKQKEQLLGDTDLDGGNGNDDIKSKVVRLRGWD
ncbi:hypothetical protein H4219_004803 [Mycoemilia scoparia]|uniref:Conserved oligomeric Golgi complex subunit 7 n=1 Tax=Mycoemilia scoparia TaxID=417184 RepID=A0A9W7ZQG0_9FUNG|nr:hypothetical protein H4219_004803 [Mycoemilia scoparia]